MVTTVTAGAAGSSGLDATERRSARPGKPCIVAGPMIPASAVSVVLLGALLVGCQGDPKEVVAPKELPVPVHAVRAEPAPVFNWAYGEGTAVATRREALYFELEGKVSYVREDADGEYLRPGDVVKGPKEGEMLGELLAKLDDRDVAASLQASRADFQRTQQQRVSQEAQVKSARAELKAAKRDLGRATALADQGAMSVAELDQAKDRVVNADASLRAAEAQLGTAKSSTSASAAQVTRSKLAVERTAVFAPFDGVVAAVNIRPGDHHYGVRPSSDLGEQLRAAPVVVIDPSSFEIDIQLPAYEAQRVEVGQPVFVVTGEDVASAAVRRRSEKAIPELLPTRGRVFSVSPAIDPGARSILVTVRIDEQAERIRDGDYVSTFIMVDKSDDGLRLPRNALLFEDERVFAFVVDEPAQSASRRELTVGLNGAEMFSIASGLNRGDLVVTRGRRMLGEGTSIDVVTVEELPATPPQVDESPAEAAPPSPTPPSPNPPSVGEDTP